MADTINSHYLLPFAFCAPDVNAFFFVLISWIVFELSSFFIA